MNDKMPCFVCGRATICTVNIEDIAKPVCWRCCTAITQQTVALLTGLADEQRELRESIETRKRT